MSEELESALHLYRVLARTFHSVMDHTTEDLKSYGLPATEFAVLELLYNKGPQPLQKIGEKILRTSGSVTYVIDKLEKSGLISREPDQADRRVTYAVLTPVGRSRMDEIFPAHAMRISESCSHLSETEKTDLTRLLKKLGLGVGSGADVRY